MKNSSVMSEMVHGYVVSYTDDIHRMFIKACNFFGVCVCVCVL